MGEPQFVVKINLPISEEFANFLFQGRYMENVDGTNMLRFKWELKFEIPGHERRLTSLEELFHKITADCQREHGGIKTCGHIYPMDILFFYIVSGRTGVIVGRFYGIWNTFGPQLVVDLIKEAKNDKSVMNFIISIGKTMKKYDGIFSGERRKIGNRMKQIQKKVENTRKQKISLFHLAEPSDKGVPRANQRPSGPRAPPPLPVNVLRSIGEYSNNTKKNKKDLPSAALARLLPKNNNNTNRHGGAIRNQTRRRKH